MGGDIGGTGVTVHPKLAVGAAHASVPPIFGEVVLLEMCESANRKKQKFL